MRRLRTQGRLQMSPTGGRCRDTKLAENVHVQVWDWRHQDLRPKNLGASDGPRIAKLEIPDVPAVPYSLGFCESYSSSTSGDSQRDTYDGYLASDEFPSRADNFLQQELRIE